MTSAARFEETRPVRPGEELDVRALRDLLRERLPGPWDSLRVEQFPGGYSNLTYLLSADDRQLVLRCPPHGRKASGSHDMGREYRILSGLREAFPLCPRPYFYCDDAAVLGRPFYLMERLPGVTVRKRNIKRLAPSPQRFRKLCEDMIDVLARLHTLDWRSLPLSGGARPEGYVRRQVEGWVERYRAARTPNAPTFDRVIRWLTERLPPDGARVALIHNDYKLDNILVDPDRDFAVTGVLDWEMATVGDPLMDLGCSLAYWVDRRDPWYLRLLRPMPTTAPGAPGREELLRRYSEKTGLSVEGFDYYYAFGLFRVAAIAQQIYHRFHHGQTRDRRFRSLVLAVHALERATTRVVRKSRS